MVFECILNGVTGVALRVLFTRNPDMFDVSLELYRLHLLEESYVHNSQFIFDVHNCLQSPGVVPVGKVTVPNIPPAVVDESVT
jgi:hypothetical protein